MLKIERKIIVYVERTNESEERMNYFVLDFPYYANNIEMKKNKIVYSGPEVHFFLNYMDYNRRYTIKRK